MEVSFQGWLVAEEEETTGIDGMLEEEGMVDGWMGDRWMGDGWMGDGVLEDGAVRDEADVVIQQQREVRIEKRLYTQRRPAIRDGVVNVVNSTSIDLQIIPVDSRGMIAVMDLLIASLATTSMMQRADVEEEGRQQGRGRADGAVVVVCVVSGVL